MFLDLVESNRKAKRSLHGIAVSATLHGVVVVLAIALTANARTSRLEAAGAPDKLIFVGPQRAAPPRVAKSSTPPRQPSTKPPVDVPRPAPTAPSAVTTGLPDVAPAATPAPAASSDGAGSDPLPEPGSGNDAPGTGPLTVFQVDKPVQPLGSNRVPVYPDVLRARGIEGEVFARFVVDETGRIDMKTFDILSATSPAFANAVRYALERSRFRPAEAAGRKVPQLVEQRFQFRLDR